MLRRGKVAGCLAEARDGAVVLGIGLNVNQTREQLPEDAGSLRTLTGREWDREELLSSLLAISATATPRGARAVSTPSTRGSGRATSSAAAGSA